MLGLARKLCEDGAVEAERRLQQTVQLRCLGKARQLQEELVHVLADIRVAGKEAVVGVDAGGLRVIVAGTQMAVAANAARLAPHDESELRMRLVADHSVHDVGARLLQAV